MGYLWGFMAGGKSLAAENFANAAFDDGRREEFSAGANRGITVMYNYQTMGT